MNAPSVNFDEIVVFAFEVAHEMSACMRENNWVSDNYIAWENQGFKELKGFLLEDISDTQLLARKKALLANLGHTKAQLRLFSNRYSKVSDKEAKERELAISSKMINIGYFIEATRDIEQNLLSALEVNNPRINQTLKAKKTRLGR